MKAGRRMPTSTAPLTTQPRFAWLLRQDAKGDPTANK